MNEEDSYFLVELGSYSGPVLHQSKIYRGQISVQMGALIIFVGGGDKRKTIAAWAPGIWHSVEECDAEGNLIYAKQTQVLPKKSTQSVHG